MLEIRKEQAKQQLGASLRLITIVLLNSVKGISIDKRTALDNTWAKCARELIIPRVLIELIPRCDPDGNCHWFKTYEGPCNICGV